MNNLNPWDLQDSVQTATNWAKIRRKESPFEKKITCGKEFSSNIPHEEQRFPQKCNIAPPILKMIFSFYRENSQSNNHLEF